MQAVIIMQTNLSIEITGSHWERPHYRTEAAAVNPLSVDSVLQSKGNKLSTARNVLADLAGAMVSLGSDEFAKNCAFAKEWTRVLNRDGRASPSLGPRSVGGSEGLDKENVPPVLSPLSNRQPPTYILPPSLVQEEPERVIAVVSDVQSSAAVGRRTASLPCGLRALEATRSVDLDSPGKTPCLPTKLVKTQAAGAKRKASLPCSLGPMEGLDETFKMADDDYFLGQVNVRKVRIRTSAKNRNRGSCRLKSKPSSELCGVCLMQFPPVATTSTVDWVGCDFCHAWFHRICCGQTDDCGQFICLVCGRRDSIK